MDIPILKKPLTEQDLRTPRFLDRLHTYINFAAEVNGGDQLWPWYKAIQQAIEHSPSQQELSQILKTELAQMRFLCLVELYEDDVPQIFISDIAFGLKIEATESVFEPWVLIRKRLSTVPHWLRNDYKSKWLRDLHQNEELLSSTPIMVSGAQVSGTVMNWLKDYDLFVGTLAPADALKKTEYIFKGANVLKTPVSERKYIQSLVDIYEKLKLDSLSPEGIEEVGLLEGSDGRFKEIIDGVMYDQETGLVESEYKTKFGSSVEVAPTPPRPTPPTLSPVTTQPASVPAPVVPPPAIKAKKAAVVSKPAKKTVSAKPPVKPEVKASPAPVKVAPAVVTKPVPPAASERVAPVAKTVEIDMQAMPPTVIARPSPAAASPQQTPIETGSLPTGAAQPKAGELVFSDEDEKEVATIKRAQKVFFKAPTGIDYDFVAKRVMGIHKLFFPSYDLERRFVNLITSYMKGVRDEMEFRDIMTRPENTGGLNLSGDTTDKILLTISEEATSAPQAKARKLKEVSASQMTPSMGQVQKAMEQTKSSESTMTVTGEMKAAAQPSTTTRPKRVAAVRPVTTTTQGGVMPTVQASAVRAPLDARKPMMTDIKVPPKVMGPVDELANLSLQEFRRLGSTAQAATEKIKSKIDLLETESLLKKAEGIRAWQASPTNQLYLSLGQEALGAGRAVEDVLQQKQLEKKPALTKQEFDAIADLNRRLRY